MLKAREIMTGDVITVSESTTLEELGRLFIEKGISGAPVVDANGELTGVVTENDLISRNSRLHIPTILRLFDAYLPLGTSRIENEIKRMTASTVGEICVKNPITVEADTTLEEIATIMTERKIHLLPVVENKRLVGIVGKRDLIKGFADEASQ